MGVVGGAGGGRAGPGGEVRQRGLSGELALVELTSLSAARLLSVIAESAKGSLEASRAAAWAYVPSLRRFTVEHGPSNVEAVMATPAEAGSLMRRAVVWGGDCSVVQHELAVRSFGLDWSAATGCIVSLPLRAQRTSSLLLCLVDGEAEAADLMARSALFVRQAEMVIANFHCLQAASTHEAQLSALYETAIAITAEIDLDSVLGAIVEHARRLVGTPISYVMLVDPDGTQVSTRATVGTWSPQFASLVLGLGVGLGGRAAKEIRPLYTKDYLNDGHFSHHHAVDEAVRLEGIKSILGVPLTARQKLVGVLYAADQVERVFTENDVEVLTRLARHATLAVENATLYRSLASTVRELERYQQVAEAQCRRLEIADRLNRELSDVVLSGGGIEGIARQVAVLTGSDVAVVSSGGRLVAWASGEQPSVNASTGGTDAGHRRLMSILASLDDSPGLSPGSGERCCSITLGPASSSGTVECVVAPLTTGGDVYGSICLIGGRSALRNQEPLLQVAARVVTLELVHAQAIAQVEERARRDFLEDLMLHASDDDALLRRGAELGIDLSRPHHLAVVALEQRQTGSGEGPSRSRRPVDARAERARLARDLVVAAPCVFAGQIAELVVALLESHTSVPSAAALQAALSGRPKPELAYRAVITSQLDQIAAYGPAFADARRALPLVPVDSGASVVDLASAGVLPLLFHSGGATALRQYVERTLGPLLCHDARHGGQLIPTLAAYVEAGFSPGAAADRLHAHVNTVYYRLRKIEALLGSDALEPGRLAEYQIALLARRLLDSAGADTVGGFLPN